MEDFKSRALSSACLLPKLWKRFVDPLSLVVANLFMEDFKSRALSSARLLPKLWKRFVDDTGVIWSHDLDELDLFFRHLNE